MADKKSADRIVELELEIGKLESELHESYELIDELEFEVEQVYTIYNANDTKEKVEHIFILYKLFLCSRT